MAGKSVIAALALVIVAASCSVFEDRMDCPCFLVVDYALVNDQAQRPTAEGRVHSLLYNPECCGNITHMSISCPDYDTIACTKGEAVFSAIYSPAAVPLKSARGVIVYSVGHEVDSVYGCHESLSLYEEKQYVKVAIHKQFSTVNLIVKESDALVRGADLTVVGNSCGYDVMSFAPVTGEYRLELEGDSSQVRSFRIPRQADYSLTLHIERASEGDSYDFPLGECLADIGYDFDVPDLSDFDVEIDLAKMTALIKVMDWDKEYIVEVFD